jgi:hypothetical protein
LIRWADAEIHQHKASHHNSTLGLSQIMRLQT